jgi:HD-GYP domain-containing protein (c-di-GMP phosphodiesterase class II)
MPAPQTPTRPIATFVNDERAARDVLVSSVESWCYEYQSATLPNKSLEFLGKRPTVVADLEHIIHRQTRLIRRTFLSAIDSLVCTLEARDASTKGHSLRVRWWALRLAGVLGLGPQKQKWLSLAAKLHDIGKVGVPEVILNKPARLNDEEYRRMKEHPIIGERILKPVIRNQEVLAAVRGHHERFDGQGYPDGLRATGITELARIIAVVDCYDALTSFRSYRKILSVRQALRVIREGAGSRFDPIIVQAFITAAPQLARRLAGGTTRAISGENGR